ncbi:heme o synthase [Solemya elarraichensis gill symbiont]|uniref:Protoheme IX farnesyltransferase n=1 Tax=Solemya elarraichensis gill symbiont TaxID=1918949 RepID=A0A1T2L8N1_9GAMM|nr:heme o synthase [Solemya elarraichensis gill symbiont]OOZ41453.1 protoheme IX farnesyltransferase [Solemya elarraichensis gill symbiont]
MAQRIFRFPWNECYALCKPKVVALIVFTAVVGMLLSTSGALPPLDLLIYGTLGIGLGAASGAAVNHYVDQRIDAIMDRTHNRPLPAGKLSPATALGFAISIGILSMAILLVFVNTLTAMLTLISMIGYAVIYTMFLKRATPQNIVLGGAAGAAPPLLGWTAITGEVNYDALLLFLIIFVWTPPHFWALAIKRRKEYAKADIPMLPVTHGVIFTKQHILLYTLLLFAVTLMPFVTEMSGLVYLAGALSLGIGFTYHAMKLLRSEGDEHSMKTFGFSIFYLSALFAFFLVDHYAREFIRGVFL